MKKLIILGFLIVGTTQAENLTDVLNVALDKDPQLSAARYTQLASEENKKQAWANFLPQVSGSWSKNESRSTREDRFLGTSVPRDVPDSQSESWQVTLNQAIYNHSNTLAVKQANLEKAKGFVDFELVKQDFLIRVAQSYFDVLTNIDAVKFAQAEEKAIHRQLDQAEQRYEVGLAAITDVHEARAQYDNSRASVINAKNILDDTKEALFEISQQYYQSLTALPDEIGQISLGNNALEDWEKIALKNNPDLGAAKITAELAEL
ncbi:MAG: TolC family protein, partial [Proteobacteria bacterium]|nr:TolC family protein [Pseudomonadota bacterium]